MQTFASEVSALIIENLRWYLLLFSSCACVLSGRVGLHRLASLSVRGGFCHLIATYCSQSINQSLLQRSGYKVAALCCRVPTVSPGPSNFMAMKFSVKLIT